MAAEAVQLGGRRGRERLAHVGLEAARATHLPWSLESGPAVPGPVGLTRYRVGDLALVECRCGPCARSRGRAQLTAPHADLVGVLFVREGVEFVEVAGSRVVADPGTFGRGVRAAFGCTPDDVCRAGRTVAPCYRTNEQ